MKSPFLVIKFILFICVWKHDCVFFRENEIIFFNIIKSTWETIKRKFVAGFWNLLCELKWLAAQKLTTLLVRTSFLDSTYESLHCFLFFQLTDVWFICF